MRWKAVFLAVLILSSLMVTVGAATLKVVASRTFSHHLDKVALPTQTPLQPIDDESGGG